MLCFLADKTEPGAWNLPLFRIFADPFCTAGLVIDPKMHQGFIFTVHDLFENRQLTFDCPREIYDLLLFIGAPQPLRHQKHHLQDARRDRRRHLHPTTRADGRPLRRKRRPGPDRPRPIRPTRRRRGARTVLLPPHRRRLHARLPLDEMEYTTMPAVAKRLADRWTPIPDATPVALPH